VFVGWSLLAYRASSAARDALVDDEHVSVTRGEHHRLFKPRGPGAKAGLLFYPGALVDPVAYAPLLKAVAAAGFPSLLMDVPMRGAFGAADGAEPFNRGVAAMRLVPEVTRWVVSGHSRGGKIAAELVRTEAPSLVGLVLIGTSHPRDFSLAQSRLRVTRVYGTRDTVADVEKLESTKVNLPPGTRHVRIDGGNHSQFGSYGFQPGDWPATISRNEQQRQTLEAALEMLRAVEQ
jgi:pimeloyl-ACP methyl ester carboxylesterase